MRLSREFPRIVSASRRTDIPQFFGAWFARRRRDGYCESRNVFGGAYRISLREEDVLAYLFWSKNTEPFEGQLRALRAGRVPVAIQFTLTGYGPGVESGIPGLPATVPAFRRASAMLSGPEAIQWRYDPIVLTSKLDADWHRRNFRAIARGLDGATRVCNVSLVEPYLKVVRRLGPEVAYRPQDVDRHRSVSRGFPGLRRAGPEAVHLVAELRAIAAAHGMELRSCADPGIGLPAARCCGAELFAAYGIAAQLEGLPAGPTRRGCRCLKAVDIGMDNTCPGGCRYCYVTDGTGDAARNRRVPAEDSVRMRP